MSEMPFWSVIVPTYQREKIMCETIEYLLALSYPNYELLVIDPDAAARSGDGSVSARM